MYITTWARSIVELDFKSKGANMLPVKYNANHLDFERELVWEEAEKLALMLTGIVRGHAWWWADFLGYVEKAFPDRWTQLIPTEIPPDTLRNWRWVGSRFPRQYREMVSARGGVVPWSVYQALASVPEETRFKLLEQIAKEGLTLGDAKRLIGQGGRGRGSARAICPNCEFEFEL